MDELPIIFRKWPDGDVIAFFPTLVGTHDPNTCESYMHIGQHGAANTEHIHRLARATPEEYEDLLYELENLYTFNPPGSCEPVKLVIKDRSCSHYFHARVKELNRYG